MDKESYMQRRAWWVSVLGAAVLVACSGVGMVQAIRWEKPEFSYLDARLDDVSLKKLNLILRFKVVNRNSTGLKNVFASYDVSFEGHRITRGSDVPIDIPSGESVIQVPAEIGYKEATQVLGPLLRRYWQGDRTVPLDLHITLYGKPTLYNGQNQGELFSFTHTIDKRVDVPLSREPRP